jgi:hypothetical protein
MGSISGRSDGLMRAKCLAVGKVHTVVDFRGVRAQTGYQLELLGAGIDEGLSQTLFRSV